MSSKFSQRHAAARAYAQAGIPVFPCVVDGKVPATSNGFNAATTNLDTVDKWWAEADYNIGCCPENAGWCVVDCDSDDARAWFEAAYKPVTTVVKTPRGTGRHYYFAGSLPPSVSKLHAGVDVRGRGSYVLLPPSYVVEAKKGYEGSYEWVEEAEVAEVPAALVQAAETVALEKREAQVDALDLPGNISRAIEFISRIVSEGRVSVETKGGDNRLYKVAADIRELGLSFEKTCELLWDRYNPHCLPPWKNEEYDAFIETIDHAYSYAQNEIGASGTEPASKVFEHSLPLLLEASKQEPPRGSDDFEIVHISQFHSHFKEPQWIIPGLIPEGGLVQIVGKQKSFKTFLALDMVMAMAAGTTAYDHPIQPMPVLYTVGENASAFARNHAAAWCVAKEREYDFPFFATGKVPLALEFQQWVKLVSAIKKMPVSPKVLVIDTATRAMRGLDENSAKDAGVFSQMCDFLRQEISCTILVIRHTGKDSSRGGRGSNVIDGDFDTTLEVERFERSMAVSLHVREQRNAAEREKPYTFEGRLVGPSLVFFPTTEREHRESVREEDPFSARSVAAVLMSLEAYGQEHAVPTRVLAVELLKEIEHSPEDHEAHISRLQRQLKRLARTTLSALVDPHRADHWSLDAPEKDGTAF